MAARPGGVTLGDCNENPFDVGDLNYGYFEIGRALLPHERAEQRQLRGLFRRRIQVIAQRPQSMMGEKVGECFQRIVGVGSPN